MKKLLHTEMRNPRTTHIDRMGTLEMLQIMNQENRQVPDAVDKVLKDLAPLVDHVAEKLPQGGRLIYVGAGTSGRIAVMDAAECPPTFGVPQGQVTALLAGAPGSMLRASEGAEDSEALGRSDLAGQAPGPLDTVVGISAAGGAAYVAGALKAAKEAGCATACICCNRGVPLEELSDFTVCPDTGPEVITGSTRLKAGTAQKLILNMLSTAVMVKTGKVYENFMVNIRPSNIKLKARAVRIVSQLADVPEEDAGTALDHAGGDIPRAVEQLRESKKEGNP